MTAKIRPLYGAGNPQQPVRALPIPPSERALRQATLRGYEDGERFGYVHGWRYGVLCGATIGVPTGMGVMWACIELGRLLGAAP